MLPWSYGLEITRLVMAAYMSAEKKRVVDLTDAATQRELETYVPLIQQGRGAGQLYGAGGMAAGRSRPPGGAS